MKKVDDIYEYIIGLSRKYPNKKLPSQGQLEISSNLSRSTIRAALSNLVNLGVIYSVKGKGYYPSNTLHSVLKTGFTIHKDQYTLDRETIKNPKMLFRISEMFSVDPHNIHVVKNKFYIEDALKKISFNILFASNEFISSISLEDDDWISTLLEKEESLSVISQRVKFLEEDNIFFTEKEIKELGYDKVTNAPSIIIKYKKEDGSPFEINVVVRSKDNFDLHYTLPFIKFDRHG